jgi:hypothetical protein
MLLFERAEELTADLRSSKRKAKKYLLHDLKDGSVVRISAVSKSQSCLLQAGALGQDERKSSVCYIYSIVTKFAVCRNILTKLTNIAFNENSLLCS